MPSMSKFPHSIENGVKYQYFPRYSIKVRNSNTNTVYGLQTCRHASLLDTLLYKLQIK